MDTRFLIVGTPFIISFFYSLFWLKRWGAFKTNYANSSKKMIMRDKSFDEKYILENIFFTKN